MENMKIRDLMRPIEEFPRIAGEATFFEAVDALEEAERQYRAGKALQRILLVYDEAGNVVGKITPMDVLQGLEPNYESFDALKSLPRYRPPSSTVEFMKKSLRFWQKPLAHLCRKAASLQIRNFMKKPSADYAVQPDDGLDTAFHRFVVGRHDSLFVTDNDVIVGLLRFSDVYRKIVETLRGCHVPE